MKDELAERLLALIMKWNAQDIARERPDLQALAVHKYNGYEQFSAGMRFVENLALWLAQFENDEDRSLAYSLIKSRLVFVSPAELTHLVSIAFPDFIRHMLVKTVGKQIQANYGTYPRLRHHLNLDYCFARAYFWVSAMVRMSISFDAQIPICPQSRFSEHMN